MFMRGSIVVTMLRPFFFCLKPEASRLRAKICYFGVMLSNAIYNAGLIPLNVLVTKTESTDFDLVRHDFKFQRIMHA